MVNFEDTILLTGIPRSGTTLCCHILNQFMNTVALHEPIDPSTLPDEVPEAISAIKKFLTATRQRAYKGVALQSKQLNGAIPDNPVSLAGVGERQETVALGEVEPGKELTENFRLVVKHNALFTALSEQLASDFKIYALVRNPLPVLASWRSVNLPVGEGKLPMGERYDGDLKERLSNEHNVLERQLIILKWFFDAFRQLPVDSLLTYESIVQTDGEVLGVLSSHERTETTAIDFQFKNSGLVERELVQLASVLLERTDIYEDFYVPGDIESDLEKMLL